MYTRRKGKICKLDTVAETKEQLRRNGERQER